MSARGLVLAACLALAAAPDRARADDEPSPKDIPLADQLFREGKRLLADGLTDEACLKFEESQRLDPSGGTLMNLARCHRLQRKWATAYAEYSDAYGIAKREQREDRMTEARSQLDEIAPLVMRVALVVPADVAALPGFTLSRNGVLLSAASWGTVQPVDPGTVVVEASAPGYRPFKSEVVMEEAGASITLTVPALERLPTPVVPWRPPTPVPPAAAAGIPATRVAGIVVTGAGGVSVVLGAIAGGVALSKQSDADEICPGTSCSADAVALNEDAHTAATLANVGIFGGLGLAAVGVVLIAVNPNGPVRPTASGLALTF